MDHFSPTSSESSVAGLLISCWVLGQPQPTQSEAESSETALRQKYSSNLGGEKTPESRKGKSARTCKDENQETSGEESEGDGDNGGTKDGTKGAKDGTKEAEGVHKEAEAASA